MGRYHYPLLIMHCLQKGPYFKDLVLNKDLFGILGPYFHYLGFIRAKNVNSVCTYTTMSYFDLCVTSNYLHCYYTCML